MFIESYPMNRETKLVLIDCNKAFRAQMRSFAESRGINLECYSSILEMGSVSGFKNFDVAIVENDNGTLSGLEVGEYLTALFEGMPLILVSCGLRPSNHIQETWPDSIKGFVHKTEGPDAVLDIALQYRNMA